MVAAHCHWGEGLAFDPKNIDFFENTLPVCSYLSRSVRRCRGEQPTKKV